MARYCVGALRRSTVSCVGPRWSLCLGTSSRYESTDYDEITRLLTQPPEFVAPADLLVRIVGVRLVVGQWWVNAEIS